MESVTGSRRHCTLKSYDKRKALRRTLSTSATWWGDSPEPSAVHWWRIPGGKQSRQQRRSGRAWSLPREGQTPAERTPYWNVGIRTRMHRIPTPPGRICKISGGNSRPSIRGRSHTPLACPWIQTSTQKSLTKISHHRRRWRQHYDASAYTGWVYIPTSVFITSISGDRRHTRGNIQRPPAERAMDVPGRPGIAHVAHGGNPPVVGMDNPGPGSKR